ncbi:MAG: Cytochrome bc complex cytochrome b subunit [Syntrophorhabdus sp. PtaB.Bin006]|nr:MAG: Cytochrome bc complex cytochrome b subunit [Syntrophorhabdus sp. PtaB.Bin006]
MSFPRLRSWFSERYDIERIKDLVGKKTVPAHRYEIAYYTGGIALFLFVIQFITGMVLSLYYIPYFEQAHHSIIEIVTKLNMGWFFRSLHHWGAQIAIIALFVHLWCTLLLKAYRKPRELLWFSGFVLLGISIFFGLSGYLLLWDERAFAAVRVATGGAGSLPFVGSFIKAFLRGGTDVSGDTLTRFYAFHVSILPLFTVFLIAVHLLLVQCHGMSVPLSVTGQNRKDTPFFPNVFYKDLIAWLIILGIVVTLATLLPPEILGKADPLAPAPENIKPEWYFLFLFQTLKLFPGVIFGLNGETIAILLISAGILFLFLIPFFDRKSQRGEKSTLFTWIGVIYLFYFLIMTVIGFIS